ncbi:MAG: MFS transporter [Gemmatimonadetes bacterium]|nr:MFS transporter [Gemmatimonadota bacterium]
MLRRISRWLNTAPEVVALSFARMADALGNSLLIIVLPLYIAREPSPWLHLPTELLVGLAVSLYGFLLALGQPFAGRISDRSGKRKQLILVGLAVMALATVGLIFAHRFVAILMLRGAQGLGVALIVPSVMALITTATEIRDRGNAMGIYTTFRMTGFAMGPVLAGVLQVHFGFNVVFIVGGSFLALAFVLVHLTVHPPATRPAIPASSRPTSGGGSGSAGSHDGSTSRPSGSILALMFATVVLASSLSMISALENEFNARLSQTAIGFGIAFSSLTVSRLVVQIPIGRWSDRIGRKKLIIGGLLTLSPLTVLFGYVASTAQLVALRLVQGVSIAAVAAPAFALAGDLARPGREGQEISWVTMGFGLGLGAGPLLAGGLAGYLGFAVPFYVTGLVSLLAAWAVWRFTTDSIPIGA